MEDTSDMYRTYGTLMVRRSSVTGLKSRCDKMNRAYGTKLSPLLELEIRQGGGEGFEKCEYNPSPFGYFP